MKSFWIISLFLFFVCIECNSYSQPSTNNKLAGEIGKFIAEKYGLIPGGVGGGKTKEGLSLISVSFCFNGKPLKIEEGRKLFIEVLEDSLEFINSTEKKSNELGDYLFTFKNLDLTIFCYGFKGEKVFDPYMNTIFNTSNGINYFT